MRLYLYALANGLAEVSGLSGVAREPLVLVPAGKMIVAGGWIPQAPAIDRESLSVQDRIVRELHARADALLPMRFGSSVTDEAELIRKIESLEPGLGESLELVKGREQMTLRVLRGSSPGAAADSIDFVGEARLAATGPERGAGANYLESRRAAAVPPELAGLIAALRPLPRATRVERGRGEAVLATVYHLIDRGSSGTYRAEVSNAAATRPSLHVRVSGPGPAYAFASLTPPLGT